MDTQQWSYSQDYLWKTNNPSCNGTQQSPINIDTSESSMKRCGILCDLQLNLKPETPSVEFTYQNDIILTMNDSKSSLTFNHRFFILRSAHIHIPSLHAIDNNKTDMEVVLLFDSGSKNDTSNENSIQNQVNGVQLCFMINQSDNEYGSVEEFFDQFINKIPTTQGEKPLPLNVSSTWGPDLLIPNKESFYYYNGSLSYPPCTENYITVVYEEIGTIGVTNHRLLKKYIRNNTRPIKPRGERIIYYNPGKSKERRFDSVRTVDNRFLQCERNNSIQKPEPQDVYTPSKFDDSKVMHPEIANKIKNRLLFVLIGLLIFLAYLVILYLYKTFNMQKIVSSFVPKNIMRENIKSWKTCSGITENVVDNVRQVANTISPVIAQNSVPLTSQASSLIPGALRNFQPPNLGLSQGMNRLFK